MEDFALDLVIGKGPAARTVRVDLPQFTIVGATTRVGLMTGPLRDRFGATFRLNFYKVEELRKIVQRSAQMLGIKTNNSACLEIAKRARGTPRIANRLLKRIRDFAEVKGDGIVTPDIVSSELDLMDVDAKGLDQMDRQFLEVLVNKFNGGPVGLDTIAAALSEDAGTIEDVIEPFLLQEGLLNRTRNGRVATQLAYRHIGIALEV